MRTLPLVVSVLALLVGMIHFAFSRGPGDKELADLQARVETMATEIDDLRAALRTNEVALRRYAEAARPGSAPAPAPAPAEPGAAQPSAGLPAPEPVASAVVPAAASGAQEQARRTFLDRTKPASERVDALLALRKSRDGRTEEVARVALELAQDQAVAPPLRAEALRHLSRLDYPSMKEPLLGILTRERDSNTRTEAVELLQRFLDDPGIKTALQAAQNDPDRRVRDEARRRLADWESKQGR
jgi:HEAT repeats